MKSFKITLLIGLILAITFSAFLPCLQNGFVNIEDEAYTTEARILQELSLKNIKHIFTSFHLTLYQPLSRLSFLLEYKFFKLEPFVCHLINIILHLLNCILVFWLIYLLARSLVISSLTTILFAIHPFHVQSVAWISDRNDLLCAVFFLASIICYCYYLRKREINKCYWFCVILFVFSLLSKPMSITLPIILFLIDYLLRRKPDKSIFLDKIPFFILSIIFSVLAFITKYSSDCIGRNLPSFLEKTTAAVYAIVFYLGKTLIPTKLSFIYPYHNAKDILPLFYTLPILVILSIGVVVSRKYTRKVIFGSLFFLVTLLPVLQFVPIKASIVADRYTYIPSFGLFYLAACGFVWIYARVKRRLKPVLLLLLVTIVCIFTYLTWIRCQAWKDSFALWNDVISSYSTGSGAYNNRGVTYYMKGNLIEAISDYNKAIELNPKFIIAYYNRANAYYDQGGMVRAISDYSKAIELVPNFLEAYQKRAVAYFYMKEYDKSWEDVHKLEELGYQVSQKFIKNLKEASGRER